MEAYQPSRSKVLVARCHPAHKDACDRVKDPLAIQNAGAGVDDGYALVTPYVGTFG